MIVAVDYNGNQVWDYYNPSDPGYVWQDYYQGSSLYLTAIENSDGSSTEINYDIWGQSWQTATEDFAANGQQTSAVWQYNDGSSSATYFDYNSSSTWSAYTDFYNTSGQETSQVTDQTDGDEVIQDFPAGRTLRISWK